MPSEAKLEVIIAHPVRKDAWHTLLGANVLGWSRLTVRLAFLLRLYRLGARKPCLVHRVEVGHLPAELLNYC